MTKWDPHTIVKTHMCYDKEHNTHVNQPYTIKWDAEMITKHCQVKFTANVEFPPKVLDAAETMVLFN